MTAVRSLDNKEGDLWGGGGCCYTLGERQWSLEQGGSSGNVGLDLRHILEIGPEEHAGGLAMGWGEEMMAIKDNS